MRPANANLERYARNRDALLARIVRLLRDDARVDAAWLSGSFGRDDADAWSDIDLHVAVTDASFDAFLDERAALYERVDRPVLVQSGKLSNSMPGGQFQLVIYPGPVEVDWNIGPTGQAQRTEHSRLLFDRVGIPIVAPPGMTDDERRTRAEEALTFFWAMTPIAVKYAGRGDSRRAVIQIELLVRAATSLSWLVEQPEAPDPNLPANNVGVASSLHARLPRLERTDPASILGDIRVLCGEVERLHPALEALGVRTPDDMPGETARLLAIAERVISRREMEIDDCGDTAS